VAVGLQETDMAKLTETVQRCDPTQRSRSGKLKASDQRHDPSGFAPRAGTSSQTQASPRLKINHCRIWLGTSCPGHKVATNQPNNLDFHFNLLMSSNFWHALLTSQSNFHRSCAKLVVSHLFVTAARRTWLALVVTSFALAHALQAQTNFTRIAGGNWSVAASWSPSGVPGPADTATIGAFTVTLNVDASVATLNLNGSTLSGDGTRVLTVLNSGSWSGGTLSNVKLKFEPACSFTFSGSTKTLGGGGVITNAGTVSWTAGQFNLDGSPTLYNQPGALFDVQFDGTVVQIGFGTSTFRNEGTYRKSAGLATHTIQIGSFINSGTVAVTSGVIGFVTTTLSASGVGNTFSADAGASVLFAQGVSSTYNFTNTTFSGLGLKTITNSVVNTVTGTINATNLVHTAGTWQGAATLNGVLEWTGGTLAPQLTIAPGSTLKLSGNAAKTLGGGGVITNAGTVTWTAGLFILGGSPTFYNQPGALFDVQFDGTVFQSTGGTSTFRNEGTYRKSAGSGTHTIQIGSFINTGTVATTSGVIGFVTTTLSASGVGNTFSADAGASVLFAQGVSSTCGFTNTTFSGLGLKTITNSVATTVTGTINATNLFHTAGIWQGAATLNGVLEWTGGSLAPQLTIAPGSTLKLSGNAAKTLGGGGVITNAGTVTWTAGLFILGGSPTFYNQPGALFDVQFDGTVIQSGGGTSTFRNEGTYRKSAGSATHTIQIGSFINSGTVAVTSGVIGFVTTTLSAIGVGNTFSADAGASVLFAQGVSSTCGFTNTTFSGLGLKTITNSGATTVTGTINATNLFHTAGIWQGAATLNGVLEWTGGTLAPQLTIAPGSTLKLSGNAAKTLGGGGVITNAGTLTWTSGQFNLDGSPTFYNQPGALFDVQFDGTVIQIGFGTSTFRNEGTYRKSAGSATHTIQIVSFVQLGNLEVLTGFIRVVGNFSPGVGSTFKTFIGGTTPGTGFGQLQVSASATLAGTLSLALTNGFAPATNQTFQIITAGSRSGVFPVVVGSAVGNGLYLTPAYLANGVRLNVVNGTPTLTNLARASGRFQFQLQGTVGGNYQIDATTNLANWVSIATNQIPGAGFTDFIDTDSAFFPYRFYRVLFLP